MTDSKTGPPTYRLEELWPVLCSSGEGSGLHFFPCQADGVLRVSAGKPAEFVLTVDSLDHCKFLHCAMQLGDSEEGRRHLALSEIAKAAGENDYTKGHALWVTAGEMADLMRGDAPRSLRIRARQTVDRDQARDKARWDELNRNRAPSPVAEDSSRKEEGS